MDALVWEKLSAFLEQPALLHRLMTEQHAEARPSSDRSALDRGLREADRALLRAREALDRGLSFGGDIAELSDAATRARQRLDRARSDLAAYSTPSPGPTLKEVQERLKQFDARTVSVDRRNRIAQALLDRAVVSADGQTLHLEGVLPAPEKSFGIATRCGS